MANRTYEDTSIPFGKYKGQLICDLPTSYLNWLLEQDFFEKNYPGLYDLVGWELEFRDIWGKHI